MRRGTWMAAAFLAAASWIAASQAVAQDPAGKTVYEAACVACHGTGVLGAPKIGDAAAWKARAGGSLSALVTSAKAGKGAMPPKGGNASLTDAQLAAAIAYMMADASAKAPAAAPATPAAAAPPAAAPKPVVAATASTANSFNRLLRAPGQRNRPPAEDGIHDAANDGTLALQAPLASFQDLPRSNAGNRVDWVKSMRENRIAPRADRLDEKVQPMIMDLNIVREVKGSMPDVVYPHKQHTEWLDCSNCHPAIFKPQKGANQISMASILLGEACGVCHGKVAFPVSECRLCHSKAKPMTANAGAAPAEAAK
jgi:c(7)-type cytochrome triheme protein